MSHRHEQNWLAKPKTIPRFHRNYLPRDYQPWMRRAACTQGAVDPEAWFPDTGRHNPEAQLAIAICKACPVRELCLDYALENHRQGTALKGIWAGTTYAQRRELTARKDSA